MNVLHFSFDFLRNKLEAKKYPNIAYLLFSKKIYYFWIHYHESCKPILWSLQLLLFVELI